MFKKAIAAAVAYAIFQKEAVIPVKPVLKYMAKKVISGAGKRVPRAAWWVGRKAWKHPFAAMGVGAALKGVKSFTKYPYA